MSSSEATTAYELTPEQKYEFDLQGYIVLKQHYDADAVAELPAGIDELNDYIGRHVPDDKIDVSII